MDKLANTVVFAMVDCNAEQATLKGLAQTLRNEMSARFNWVDLGLGFAELSASRPRLADLREKLLQEIPSLNDKIFNVSRFITIVPRLSADVLRELLDIQARHRQDTPVVPLDFFRLHQQQFLLHPKKRSDKTFMCEASQLLAVKRINNAAMMA